LVLIPFGATSLDLAPLCRALGAELPLLASAGSPEEVPALAHDPRRRQYLTRPFLRALRRRQGPRERALGLTELDLYVPGLNFVFGEADPGSGCAIVSVARLGAGLPAGPDDPRWFRRLVTEAVHEVGHTYGLAHCPDPGCVMFFSNSLADTDCKSSHLCARCAPLLRPGVRAARPAGRG
jgi:archaemetzincin